MKRLRLAYFGFAFPPGVHAQFPDVNPAGHGFESAMGVELAMSFDVRYVGWMPFAIPGAPADADPKSGIPHALTLVERNPRTWFDWRAAAKLKRTLRQWKAAGWEPDLMLVYNLSPVYNLVVKWLARHFPRTVRVLLLLDSSRLGEPISALKEIRYRFKPMFVQDWDMLREFDACIGLSREVAGYFASTNTPFLWMPGGCTTGEEKEGARTFGERTGSRLRFGYFGAFGDHAGLWSLASAFSQSSLDHELHIAGHGGGAGRFEELARRDSRVRFHGFLAREDVLNFGRSCDVLVNPRPPGYGNQNSFPSKLFNYALCGRSILSTRLSGVDEVIGPEGYYIDAARFKQDLVAQLVLVGKQPRTELDRRGGIIRNRVVSEYNWKAQGARICRFMSGLPAR